VELVILVKQLSDSFLRGLLVVLQVLHCLLAAREPQTQQRRLLAPSQDVQLELAVLAAEDVQLVLVVLNLLQRASES
jgi:hypothetical protein